MTCTACYSRKPISGTARQWLELMTSTKDIVLAQQLGEQPSVGAQIRYITPIGGNVFVDLGFGAAEAALLKAEVDQVIDAKLACKKFPLPPKLP